MLERTGGCEVGKREGGGGGRGGGNPDVEFRAEPLAWLCKR